MTWRNRIISLKTGNGVPFRILTQDPEEKKIKVIHTTMPTFFKLNSKNKYHKSKVKSEMENWIQQLQLISQRVNSPIYKMLLKTEEQNSIGKWVEIRVDASVKK